MKHVFHKRLPVLAVAVLVLTFVLQLVSFYVVHPAASAVTVNDCKQLDGKQISDIINTSTDLRNLQRDCVAAGLCTDNGGQLICASGALPNYNECYQFNGKNVSNLTAAVSDGGAAMRLYVNCLAAKTCSVDGSKNITCQNPLTLATVEGLAYAKNKYVEAARPIICGNSTIQACTSGLTSCFDGLVNDNSFTYPNFDLNILAKCMSGPYRDSAEVLAALQTVSSDVNAKIASLTAAAQQASPNGTATTATPGDANTCGIGGGPTALNWILCPLTVGLRDFMGWLAEKIDNFLYVAPEKIFTPEFRTAWSSFRNVGIALIIIAGLIMVISQALGLEILDAYTIRKLMPRLAIALIGITLSWPLLKLGVTAINDIGIWAHDLILQPFQGLTGGIGDIGALQNALTGGGLIIALFAGADLLVLLSFFATIALALLIGLLVLGVRQVIITAAILLAPLAIASYILPGTQKLWSFWKNTLITTLVMYPIILGFIALGDALSRIIMSAPGGTDTGTKILGLIVYFAPFFLLPFAFKLAGGLMSTIFSLANDKNRGLFDRLSKGRQNRMAGRREAIRTGKRWQGNRVAESASRIMQTGSVIGSGKAGVNPWRMRSRARSAISTTTSAAAIKGAENEAVQTVLSSDDLMQAAMHGDRTEGSARDYLRRYLHQEGAELEQNVASIRQGRRAIGKTNLEDLIAAQNAGTATGYAGGPAEMLRYINRVAGGDRARATRILKNARAQAEKARRVDLYGGSFNESINLMDQLHRGETNEAAVNETLTRSALQHKSIYEVGGAHYQGLENMQQAIIHKVQQDRDAVRAIRGEIQASPNGQATPDQQARLETAEHEYIRTLAQTSTLVDVAGQVSERNSNVIGGILNMPADNQDGEPVSIREAISDAAMNPITSLYRRELYYDAQRRSGTNQGEGQNDALAVALQAAQIARAAGNSPLPPMMPPPQQ